MPPTPQIPPCSLHFPTLKAVTRQEWKTIGDGGEGAGCSQGSADMGTGPGLVGGQRWARPLNTTTFGSSSV